MFGFLADLVVRAALLAAALALAYVAVTWRVTS